LRITALLVLVLFTVAGAGDIITGECSSCGYRVEEVFIDRGFYPYYLTLLYSSRELGEVLVVDFDFAQRLSDSLGDEPWSGDIFDNVEYVAEHQAEYDALFDGWYPPENLADLADSDGKLPAWVSAWPLTDSGGVPPDAVLIDPYSGPLACPHCGEPTLEFEAVGCWD
jgi:hypothetical protein